MKFSKYIDHTNLKQDARTEDIDRLINEAIEYDFKAVCLEPHFVEYASKALEGKDISVCTVIGFPLGQNTIETKVFEAKNALENGADEIDMVINLSRLKDGDYDYILKEIRAVNGVKGSKILKVIIETCLLTDEEILRLGELVSKSGADFIKTSTGFSTEGASFSDLALLSQTVKGIGIKASGGIRNLKDAEKFIELGATRLGVSSGVDIMKEYDLKE